LLLFATCCCCCIACVCAREAPCQSAACAVQVLAVATADGGLCLAACGREDFWDEAADATREGGCAAAAGLQGDEGDEETPVLPLLRVRLRGPVAGGRPVRCAPAAPACALVSLRPHSVSST